MFRWIGAAGLFLGTYVLLSASAQFVVRTIIGPDGFPIQESVDAGWQERWALAFEGFGNQGAELLATMNTFALLCLWLLAPFLTADCLSSERRQGTLGILLLTPMRASDVVLAKAFVHGSLAAWLVLAAVPVLVLSLLLGGISWIDVAQVALIDASALLMTLTAGLLASSLWDRQRTVMLGAAVLAVLLAIVLAAGWAVGAGLGLAVSPPSAAWTPSWVDLLRSDFDSTWTGGLAALENPFQAANRFGGVTASRLGDLIRPITGFVIALAIAVGAVGWIARRIRASIQSQPRTAVRKVVDAESSGRQALSRTRRRVLEWVRVRNPILWAELRTWRGHLVPGLSLCLVFPCEVWRTTQAWGSLTLLGGLDWVVAAILGFAAVACLHDERGSGSLELLLTVPHGARRLLAGKLWGLTLQVLPAVILVLGIETSMMMEAWDEQRTWTEAVLAPAALAVMVVGRIGLAMTAGVFFGFRLRSLVPAFGSTLFTLLLSAKLGVWTLGWAMEASGDAHRESYQFLAGDLLSSGLADGLVAVGFALATYLLLQARKPMRA